MTDFQPAFLIGVTGHMDLDLKLVPKLETQVERFLRLLKPRPIFVDKNLAKDELKKRKDEYKSKYEEAVQEFVKELVSDNPPAEESLEQSRRKCEETIRNSLDLSDTPIVVFSSLAPGADLLVARVAVNLQSDWERLGLEFGFKVIAPQAFPYEVYPDATTFNWKGEDGTTNPESEENIKRKGEYQKIVQEIGGPENTFAVWLQRDMKQQVAPGKIAESFDASCKADLRNPEAAPRHQRYRAAGEYNAAYPHILIAIWDQDHDSDSEQGTAAIVDARRRGLSPHLLPITNPLRLPPGGPILHLTTRRLKNQNAPAVLPAKPVAPIRWLDPHVVTAPADTDGHDAPQPVEHPAPGDGNAAAVSKSDTLQLDAFNLTCRIAANLNRFNKMPVPSRDGVERELDTRLTRPLTIPYPNPDGDSPKSPSTKLEALTCHLHQHHRDLYDALRRIAGLRRRAADGNGVFEAQVHWALKWLFRLTIFAVATLHLFSHWEPQNAPPHSHAKYWYFWPEKVQADPHSKTTDPDSEATSVSASQPEAKPASPDAQTTTVPPAKSSDGSDPKDPKVIEAKKNDPSTNTTAEPSKNSQELHPQTTEGQKPPPKPASGGHTEPKGLFDWIPFALGLCALGFAFVAYVVFWFFKSHYEDVQAHDCRALAEGLRVQFYWSLIGLGESVSSNYMQRQRSELDWIRAAIRWASIPYEEWRVRFDNLSQNLQMELLKCVQHSWIKNQADYFKKRKGECEHQLHFWHKFGRTFGLAGFLVFTVLVVSACPRWPEYFSTIPSDLTAILALLATVFVVWLGWYRLERPTNEQAQEREIESVWVRLFQALRHPGAALWQFSEFCISSFVKTKENLLLGPMSPQEHRSWMLHNFSAYLQLSASISVIVLTISTLLGMLSYFPGFHNWAVILGGWCLLFGAMSVAWAEKKLYSEFEYQYRTMAALYRAAELRLDVLLERLQNSLDAENSDEFNQCMSEAKELLAALGKEALDENAEWLILHRARPLEPLMAG